MTYYDRSMKTLKKGKESSPTPDGEISIKASAGDHKTHHGDGNITHNRVSDGHSTAIEDKLSMHGLWNKKRTSLSLNGGDKKRLAPLKLDEKAEEENLEITEAKSSLLKYINQTLIMTITGQLAYFVHISVVSENNIMHTVTSLLDTGVQPNLILRDSLLPDWLSKTCKRKCMRRLYLRHKTDLKPKATSYYMSELAIYIQVYCLQ